MLEDTISYTPPNSNYMVDETSIYDVLNKVSKSNQIVVDVETDGLRPWHDNKLCGIGFALSNSEAYYIPFRHPEGNMDTRYFSDIWESLREVPRLIGHNIKFDLAFLYSDGYEVPKSQILADTMQSCRLCAREQYPSLGLADQITKFFGWEHRMYDDEFKAYLAKNKWKDKFHLAPADIVGAYCAGDVISTWNLCERTEEIIAETKQTAVWDQEQQVTHILWEMEKIGINFDLDYASVKVPLMQARIQNVEAEIYTEAGTEFNPGSPKQIGEIMHSFNIHSPKKSPKTGNESWDISVLKEIDHPVAKKILEFRALSKVLNTYLSPVIDWKDTIIHTQFKNWGTVTGRMSCAKPNLQNISKVIVDLTGTSNEEAKATALELIGAQGSGDDAVSSITIARDYLPDDEDNLGVVSVRRLFLPRDGYRLYMLDYSQMEMRVFADYCEDPKLLEMLEDPKTDFHDLVTETVFNVTKDSESDLWKFYRRLAKAINFGLIFGMGIQSLAKSMKEPLAEAKKYKKFYFDRFPKAVKFMEKVVETVERRGYIFNRYKRRYWLTPDWAYKGVNYIVQGTSADIVKQAMVECYQYLEDNNLKTRMISQVHDEIMFEVPPEEESFVPFELREIMQRRRINTFLPVNISRGNPSWAQEEEYDDETQTWSSKHDVLKVAA